LYTILCIGGFDNVEIQLADNLQAILVRLGLLHDGLELGECLSRSMREARQVRFEVAIWDIDIAGVALRDEGTDRVRDELDSGGVQSFHLRVGDMNCISQMVLPMVESLDTNAAKRAGPSENLGVEQVLVAARLQVALKVLVVDEEHATWFAARDVVFVLASGRRASSSRKNVGAVHG